MIQYDAAKEIPPKSGRRTRSEEEAHVVTLESFEPGRRLPS